MPYFKTSAEWYEQSSLLLKARPTSVRLVSYAARDIILTMPPDSYNVQIHCPQAVRVQDPKAPEVRYETTHKVS